MPVSLTNSPAVKCCSMCGICGIALLPGPAAYSLGPGPLVAFLCSRERLDGVEVCGFPGRKIAEQDAGQKRACAGDDDGADHPHAASPKERGKVQTWSPWRRCRLLGGCRCRSDCRAGGYRRHVCESSCCPVPCLTVSLSSACIRVARCLSCPPQSTVGSRGFRTAPARDLQKRSEIGRLLARIEVHGITRLGPERWGETLPSPHDPGNACCDRVSEASSGVRRVRPVCRPFKKLGLTSPTAKTEDLYIKSILEPVPAVASNSMP